MNKMLPLALISTFGLFVGCLPTETGPKDSLTNTQREKIAHNFAVGLTDFSNDFLPIEQTLSDFGQQVATDAEEVDDIALIALFNGAADVSLEILKLIESVQQFDKFNNIYSFDWSGYESNTVIAPGINAYYLDDKLFVTVANFASYHEGVQYIHYGSFALETPSDQAVKDWSSLSLHDFTLTNTEQPAIKLQAKETSIDASSYFESEIFEHLNITLTEAELNLQGYLVLTGNMLIEATKLDFGSNYNFSEGGKVSAAIDGKLTASDGSNLSAEANFEYHLLSNDYIEDIDLYKDAGTVTMAVTLKLFEGTATQPALSVETAFNLGFELTEVPTDDDNFQSEAQTFDVNASFKLVHGDQAWGYSLGALFESDHTTSCYKEDADMLDYCDYESNETIKYSLRDLSNTQHAVEMVILVEPEMDFDLNLIELGYISVNATKQATIYLDNQQNRVFAKFKTLADVVLISANNFDDFID